MNNEIQAPEPNSVEFAREPVPTMANQKVEEGWIDGRRSSQRIQLQRQRQREESEARPGPSGLQHGGEAFLNYRSAVQHEDMTSSDESNKRKIKAFNLDDLTSEVTDTDTSDTRSKTPTSPKVNRAFRQLDIAQKSPSKRRQGELLAHINRLTFEEEEILRSNTNAAKEDVMGQGVLSGIRRVNREESEKLMEDLMRHARLFDPAEMMPMYDAIRKIQNHMANLRQGELS